MEAAAQRASGAPAPNLPRAFGSEVTLDRATMLAAPLRSRPLPSVLGAPLTELRGAGPKLAAAAAEGLGIETLGDLLLHLPHSYRDPAEVVQIDRLKIGEAATIEVEVRSAKLRPTRRRNLAIFEAKVADDYGGTATAIWFNQAWLAERLEPGTRLLLQGSLDKRGFKVSAHEILGGAALPAGIHTTGIVPVHPASEGIRAQKLREWAWQALALARHAIEPLPGRMRARRRLPAVADALLAAHFPADEKQALAARTRLAFEELLLYQASLAQRRANRRGGARALALGEPGEEVRAWIDSLPFALTGDQAVAIEEIDGDLGSAAPMQRLLMGEVGSGKAQPLDASVLTPAGYRRMGEIEVGDQVINPTGETTQVTGVFPQGERDVWRVSFSDGSSVECDAEHLWQVQTSTARHREEAPKVMTTREIRADLLRPSGAAKWHVELAEAADLEGGGDRPVDPYLLGLLLGDGGFSIPDRVRFTTADPELLDAVRSAVPLGCALSQETHRPYDWKIIGAGRPDCRSVLRQVRLEDRSTLARAYEAGASHEAIASRLPVSAGTVRLRLIEDGVEMRPPYGDRNPLLVQLESRRLMGKLSRDKAVPAAYLAAPIVDRHAVLQGLMDTDGTLGRDGLNVSFSSASRQLAEDVAWLVRSLGGRARCWLRHRASGTSWQTSVILPARFPPFRLERKARRLRPRTKYAHPAKAISRIERVGRKPAQCISVSHSNQLYVTDGFTVTHNTVVALYAMLRAVEAGHQATLMAPTETLAEQHFATLQRLLAGSPLPAALLTGATSAEQRRELLGHLSTGQLGLVVGTHALIEDTVTFRSLALAVVDEQHRFGVRQRAALDAKGPGEAVPHTLHMTATPIPRTLSLTAYGDLDTTALRELPAGRRPITTRVVAEDDRAEAYEMVRKRLREGRQAYVVCPLVAESVKLQATAATEEAKRLAAGEFADHAVDVLHGQMRSRDKAAAMERFASGATDLLVATSVIEVGIDVANATVMVIEGADRYGLSQLHQLRGRVGRGEHASTCLLFSDVGAEPESRTARARLQAIATERDGFKLAEVDLGLRGEGEILGTRQHGLPRFRAASLPDDTPLLLAAREAAVRMLHDHGSFEAPELGPLLDAARLRFGDERVEQVAA